MAAGCEVGVTENLGVRRPVVGSIAWLGLRGNSMTTVKQKCDDSGAEPDEDTGNCKERSTNPAQAKPVADSNKRGAVTGKLPLRRNLKENEEK